MIKIGELLRIIVIKTSSFWPFSQLNKIPYFIAIKSFVLLFRNNHLIKGIYLRHGLTEDNWIPGLSDIDLTIILRVSNDIDEEYLFLKSFWKRYKLLQKILPMLGEVSILNEELLKSWQKFTIRGYEYINWKLLYGEGEAKLNSKNYIESRLLEIDSINFSITNYMEFFLDDFYSTQYLKTIKLSKLNRLAQKIYRYSKKYRPAGIKNLNSPMKFTNEPEILLFCLKTVEESINYILPVLHSLLISRNDKMAEHVNYNNIYNLDWFGVDLEEVVNLNDIEGIENVYVTYNNIYIIFRDNLDDLELTNQLSILLKIFGSSNKKPVILTNLIFHYILTYYNPLMFFELIDARAIPVGKDQLPNIVKPGMYLLIKHILEEIPNILIFYQRNVFFINKSDFSTMKKLLVSIIIRSMYIRLYFDEGISPEGYKSFSSQYNDKYSIYFNKIKELERNNRVDWNIKDLYMFFRQLSYDMHNYVSESDLNNISKTSSHS